MNIYVASSWQNPHYPRVVAALREDDHDVYDFRKDGFSWSEIDPWWAKWDVPAYLLALDHPRARTHFVRDFLALQQSDACVLVLPCGLSAGIEAGWAAANRRLLVYVPDLLKPELMVKVAELVSGNLDEIRRRLREPLNTSTVSLAASAPPV